MIFHENRLLADNSHEISYLIFFEIGKDVENSLSAAVVIGALRVNQVMASTWRLKFLTSCSVDVVSQIFLKFVGNLLQ